MLCRCGLPDGATKPPASTGRPLADTNSYLLESLRGLRDILQYQNTAARAEGITAHSETLGEKQKAMKYREGVTVGAANTLIVLTALAVLGVSIRLYQNGQLGAEGCWSAPCRP